MSNSLSYRLNQELLTTIAMGKFLLTTLSIEGGYRNLYRLEGDENVLPRIMLYMYLFSLELFRDWNGVLPLLSVSSLTKLLRRTQSIYKSTNNGDYIDEVFTTTVSPGNIFGGSLVMVPSTIVSSVVSTPPAIKAIYQEITIGDSSSPIQVGDTSYTLNYPNIIENSIELRFPESNIPQNRTDQFSYNVTYSPTDATIRMVNIVDGVNIGVREGMLLIVKALRY